MKVRNKGKVHTSPSSSSAPPPSPLNAEAFSVMNLLPAAILALVSILSLQDREVLAYMITRFADTTLPDGKLGAAAVSQPENNVIEVASAEEDARETSKDATEEVAPVNEEAAVAARDGAAVSGHKGLARKVLPDMLGLFNPRLMGALALELRKWNSS
ncbi:hypothetical protein RJ640_027866 [Escallonia rubra]|uniref:Uncharacterized protein n=1 Tax=Escallonia rubra TaxID=112253 RepID=A0AA88S2Z1_9ASTE|nr:hypothetical protein RJ640_027866 [Escallonia rubra]